MRKPPRCGDRQLCPVTACSSTGELSSDDEIEKPHESDDDDEEESGPFEQTETKPLKLPSGVVIKVEKGPLAVGGGETSETDCTKNCSGSEGEGDDGRPLPPVRQKWLR